MILIWGASLLLVRGAWSATGSKGIDDSPDHLLARTRSVLAAVGESVIRFKKEQGRYPSTQEGLKILSKRTDGREPLLQTDAEPRDSWGRPFVYQLEAKNREKPFVLYSVGPNGRDESGSGDDISFWSVKVQDLVKAR